MLVFAPIRLPGLPSGHAAGDAVADLEQAWRDTSSTAEEVKAAVAAEPENEDGWVAKEEEEKEKEVPDCKWAGWEDDWGEAEVPPREEAAASSSSSSKSCGKEGAGRGAFRGGYGGGHYDSKQQRHSSDRSGPPLAVCIE